MSMQMSRKAGLGSGGHRGGGEGPRQKVREEETNLFSACQSRSIASRFHCKGEMNCLTWGSSASVEPGPWTISAG